MSLTETTHNWFRLPRQQHGFQYSAAILMLVLLAVGLATIPLKWLVASLGGVVLLVLVTTRPAIGLMAIALSIPASDLVQWSGGANLTDAMVVLALAGWLARDIARRQIVFRRPPLTWALLAFVWCLALSLTQAISWRDGLPEWLKWAEFVTLYLVATQVLNKHNVWWILGSLFAAGLAEVILGAYQFFFQVGPEAFIVQGRFLRAFGTFRQPNPYAGYLGYLAPVAVSLAIAALHLWWNKRRTADLMAGLTCTGVAGALAAGIVMSWSRGGWIGLIAGALVVVISRGRRVVFVTLSALVVLVLVFLVSGTAWLPAPIAARVSDLSSYAAGPDPAHTEITDANFSVLERLAHWQAGVGMFSDYPWLGVGIGNFSAAYATYALPHWYASLGHAHNVFLNFLAESGVIGFVAFMVFWLGSAVFAIKAAVHSQGYQKALAVGLLGTWSYLTVHNMFDNLFVSHIQLQLALLLAAVATMGFLDPTSEPITKVVDRLEKSVS